MVHKSILLPVVLVLILITACSTPPAIETVVTPVDPAVANVPFYEHVWDEVFNHGKIDMLDTCFAPDIVVKAGATEIRGIPEAKAYYAAYSAAFSNSKFTVKEIFGQGNAVCKHWVFSGTHTGEFAGIPATGKQVTIAGTTIAHLRDGKIISEEDFMDNYDFLQQLGVIPKE